MGTLTAIDKHYLAQNFLAFFRRDYRRVAEMHIESGWIPPDTRVDDFETAIRAVCEPIFSRPLKDISFGRVLMRLFQTARRFNMQVQPQLVMLQKTLLTIEGLGRQLDPDLDLWVTAKPYLERWMNEQIGWRGLVQHIRDEAPYWSALLPQIPRLVHRFLHEDRNDQLAAYLRHLMQENRRQTVLLAAIAIALSLIAGLLLSRIFGIV
jgi:ubiquinone biosynthesis protein